MRPYVAVLQFNPTARLASSHFWVHLLPKPIDTLSFRDTLSLPGQDLMSRETSGISLMPLIGVSDCAMPASPALCSESWAAPRAAMTSVEEQRPSVVTTTLIVCVVQPFTTDLVFRFPSHRPAHPADRPRHLPWDFFLYGFSVRILGQILTLPVIVGLPSLTGRGIVTVDVAADLDAGG